MHNWSNHVKILVYLYVEFFIFMFLNSYSHTLKLPLFITIQNADLNLYGFLVWTNIIDLELFASSFKDNWHMYFSTKIT